MAISSHAIGSWVAATATTQTVTLPTHSTGDMLICRVTFKHATMPTTVTCTTTGWVKLGQANGTGGASSNGGGGVEVAVFYKVAASAAETNPVISFAGVAATPSACVALSYSKGASEAWVTPAGDGAAVAAATSISATIASHVSTIAGDWVDEFHGTNDNTTLTVPTFTQTGLTLATVVEAPATALSDLTSNDISADGCYRSVTSGTSSAAAVVTATNSAADEGACWTTRLRVVTASVCTKDTIVGMSPTSYWRLGEPSGTSATDEMGVNTGTYTGSPTLGSTSLLSGDSNTAVTFSRAGSSYMVAKTAKILASLTNCSIVFRMSSSANQDLALYSERSGTLSTSVLQVGVNSTDHLRFLMQDDTLGGYNTFDSSGTVFASIQHTIGFTISGTTVVMYIDGVQDGGGTLNVATKTYAGAGFEAWVAANKFDGVASSGYTGVLDELAVFPTTLTPDQMATIHASIGVACVVAANPIKRNPMIQLLAN